MTGYVIVVHHATFQSNLCYPMAMPSVRDVYRRFTCNDQFFREIGSEAQAYWLGFLTADGHINAATRGTPKLVLSLSTKDAGHLAAFRQALGATHPLHEYKAGVAHRCVTISIRSQQLVADLTRHRFAYLKRERYEFARIAPALVHHYMRGYFDGDGCISGRQFSIVGCNAFLIAYQDALCSACALRKTRFIWKGPTPSIVYCGRHQVRRIGDFLYRDATIYLARKRERFAVLPSQ